MPLRAFLLFLAASVVSLLVGEFSPVQAILKFKAAWSRPAIAQTPTTVEPLWGAAIGLLLGAIAFGRGVYRNRCDRWLEQVTFWRQMIRGSEQGR